MIIIYIYLKAVVEVLSELDEEWGRYAREVYLVEQRLQKYSLPVVRNILVRPMRN